MMTAERKRRKFTLEFKKEAVALVTEQGYSVTRAAQAVDANENYLRRWKTELAQEASGERLSAEDRAELSRLRREVKELCWRKKFKKGQCLLCERNEVKYGFIREWRHKYPVIVLCRVMPVSPSAWYDWRGRGATLIDSGTWQLWKVRKSL